MDSGGGAPSRADVVVVGAGLVGLATARHLLESRRRDVVVLEAEERVAAHQSGHNSGVLHSGLYYRPGSAKARHCVAGRAAMVQYCQERGIPFELCGKLVVATRGDQLPALDELERRGRANGLDRVRRVDAAELREREPHVAGVAGLLVPQTGIVDYRRVAAALAEDLRAAGAAVALGDPFVGLHPDTAGWRVETRRGTLHARILVNCAGLHSDRVARRCGVDPGVAIVPFRGEYLALRPERAALVRHLVYPVPDPRFPFLGVHYTRRIDGTIEAGPNAVLAGARHGYSWRDVRAGDVLELCRRAGFWRMAGRYWRTGAGEVWRSLSKRAFVRALQELTPEVEAADLVAGGSGVRAQAVTADGRLLDDFHVVEQPGQVHVLNAPSPAATACLEIGREIATRVDRHDGPHGRLARSW